MTKITLFTTHKKASITIIVILAISFIYQYNTNFPEGIANALRFEPVFLIGLIFGWIIQFFVLFGIYYFIRFLILKFKKSK